jgi:hypothetical protein
MLVAGLLGCIVQHTMHGSILGLDVTSVVFGCELHTTGNTTGFFGAHVLYSRLWKMCSASSSSLHAQASTRHAAALDGLHIIHQRPPCISG